MGDALDDIVKGVDCHCSLFIIGSAWEADGFFFQGMNFDADKKDHKPKVFCSICHGGILEKRMFHNLALKDDDDYVDLTIRVGGKDYGPMHVKVYDLIVDIFIKTIHIHGFIVF